jgi:hypothetical protein
MDNHISEEQFQSEWFGLFGRDIGSPKQHFCDNSEEFLKFIKNCNENKLPAFCSVQPRKEYHKLFGIEKIFWDFDWADKTFMKKLEADLLIKYKKEETRKQKYDEEVVNRKSELVQEVGDFVDLLIKRKYKPLIIKTCKGFHVYVFFDKIYDLSSYGSEVIGEMLKTFILFFNNYYYQKYGYDMKYSDKEVIEDIYRVSRVPYSIHEKSGEKCFIVKFNKQTDGTYIYTEDKIRSVSKLGRLDYEFIKNEFIKNSRLDNKFIKEVIKFTLDQMKKKQIEREKHEADNKGKWELNHGFVGKMRFCFEKTLNSGEMEHLMRVACCTEAWYSGIKTREGLINVFKPLHDFKDEGTNSTGYQIDKFLEYKNFEKYKPWSCDKLIEHGFCLKGQCELYNRRVSNK